MNDELTLHNIFRHTTSQHEFEIHWTSLGDSSKPPLVFIHGTPWSSIVWHDLASTLKTRHHIFLYDHPGFGLSPQPRRLDGKEPDLDPTLALRAEASAALIQSWNLQAPFHALAHDNAGLVSLRLLLQHRLRLASLCLIDVVAIGPFGTPFFDLVANNLSVFQALPAKFVEGFVRAYVKTAAYRPLSTENEDLLVKPWLENGTQGPLRFFQEMVQAHNRNVDGLDEHYSQVGSQVPVKIIWGAKDSWLPPEIADRLFKALNARELAFVEDAGHLIHYDQPGGLACEVAFWLSEQSR